MLAREYLESLQLRQFGTRAPRTYDAQAIELSLKTAARSEPRIRKIIEENLRKRIAFESKYQDLLPTPYQSLQDYVRLAQAKTAIDETLKRVGQFQPRDDLVLGSIETEEINAQSRYWPDSSEHLIIFNRGLLLALLAVSNLVMCAIHQNPAFAQAALDSGEPLDTIHHDIVEKFAPRYLQVLKAISEGRAPDLSLVVPLYLWPEKETRWTKLEDAAMQFLFAHEYAHILLGHTNLVHRQQTSEELGGWGDEYEADSLALDLLVQTWLAEMDEADPLMIAFAMQGACLFFMLVCQIEQYSAKTCGRSRMLWKASSSHPCTYVRWLRMIDKARSKTRHEWWTSAVAPQLATIEACLASYYRRAVKSEGPETAAALEWRFQRTTVELLAKYHLVPAHLYVVIRCARAAIAAKTVLDGRTLTSQVEQADQELEAAGARPLRDYRAPLPAIAVELARLAIRDAENLGATAMQSILSRLADALLLDARTRYPLSSELNSSLRESRVGLPDSPSRSENRQVRAPSDVQSSEQVHLGTESNPTCPKCGTPLVEDEATKFSRDILRVDGVRTQCKVCRVFLEFIFATGAVVESPG
jgi:hypothetical protein